MESAALPNERLQPTRKSARLRHPVRLEMGHTVGNPCECGLDYVRGLDEDEKYHAKIHAEYTRGPKMAVLGRLPSFGLVGDFTFHVIDGSVPFDTRRKLAHVAMVAHRSIPDPAGYDGTVTEDDQRLYVLATKSHAVAMALTALDSYFWKLAWGPHGSVELVEREALSRREPKVARVWVAANHRRKGLATSLILESARHLEVDPKKARVGTPFHRRWLSGCTEVLARRIPWMLRQIHPTRSLERLVCSEKCNLTLCGTDGPSAASHAPAHRWPAVHNNVIC